MGINIKHDILYATSWCQLVYIRRIKYIFANLHIHYMPSDYLPVIPVGPQ